MIVVCLCDWFGNLPNCQSINSISSNVLKIHRIIKSLFNTATHGFLCIYLFKKKVHLPNYSKYYSIIQEENPS